MLEEDRPSVLGNFISFRIMVGLGVLYVWLAYLAFQLRGGRLFSNQFCFKSNVNATPTPLIANSFGWIVAEWGRQPWAVYGLLRTEDAVSHLTGVEVLISLVLFMSIYSFLMYLMIYLMVKEVKKFDMNIHIPSEGGYCIMDLNVIWFILVGVLIIGYAI
ncbi:cytochrome ubiquinol oxidase subunit I [Anaerobacillus sp. HL2]|nr:cytochrome ubiquinol oxidase subunit I [Anaerobacillus sp. HL2]